MRPGARYPASTASPTRRPRPACPTAPTGSAPLSVEKRDERVLLPDGTLAGSCLTQRTSFSVLRGWGLGWHDVAALSSAVPARWLGDATVGRTAPGAHAHWIELRDGEPVASWLGGTRRTWC